MGVLAAPIGYARSASPCAAGYAWYGVSLNVLSAGPTQDACRPCGHEPGTMIEVTDHAAVPTDEPLLAGALDRALRLELGYPS